MVLQLVEFSLNFCLATAVYPDGNNEMADGEMLLLRMLGGISVSTPISTWPCNLLYVSICYSSSKVVYFSLVHLWNTIVPRT